ncbi:MAG: hypothetical protein GX977_05340, partial [Firmicutes bacterium]|nr:hypothetical protein [Bacillota bacterium]
AVKEALALFGEADYCLGMRLHSLIFAAVQEVPMLGIAYDPKVEEFLRQLGLEELAIPLPNATGQPLDGELLTRYLELLEKEGDRLTAQAREKLEEMAVRLGRATQHMGELMRGSSMLY